MCRYLTAELIITCLCVNWQVRKTLQGGGDLEQILDAGVRAGHPNKEAVWKVADISMMCVEPKSIHRPTMAEVVHELRGALTLEEATNKSSSDFARAGGNFQQQQHFDTSSSGFNSMGFGSGDENWPAPR